MPNLPINDCVKLIVEASEGSLSQKDANKLLKEGRDLLEARTKAGLVTNEMDLIKDFLTHKAEEIKINSAKEAVKKMVDHEANLKFWEYLKAFKGDEVQGVLSFMSGRYKNKFGAKNSVDAKIIAYKRQTLGEIESALVESKLDSYVRKTANQQELVRALFDPLDKRVGPEAKKIADLLKGISKRMIDRVNASGADMKNIAEYVFPQNHSMNKIKKAGIDQWKEDAVRLFNPEANFKYVANVDEFLTKAYHELSTGVHLGDPDTLAGDFGKGASLTDKVAAKRQFFFKDADSFFEYHSKYGDGVPFENMLEGVSKLAKNTIMLENFGTNPRAFFDNAMKKITEENIGNAKVMADLKGKMYGLVDNAEHEFATLSGELNVPSNPSLAQTTNIIKAVESFKLGGAVLSSFPDLAGIGSGFQFRGYNLLDAAIAPLRALYAGSTAEAKGLMEYVGIASEGMNGSWHTDLASEGLGHGLLKRTQDRFFAWTGLNLWTNTLKRGVAHMLSYDMGKLASKSYDELMQSTAHNRIFTNYGIDRDLWEAWRHTASEVNGKKFMFAKNIRNADPELLTRILNNRGIANTEFARVRLNNELENKLMAYFVDSTDEMVMTPGLREQAILNAGTQAGTLAGSAVRLMGQFKAYPVGFLTKSMGREMSRGGASAFGGAASLIASSTVLGYASMTAKDYFKGLELRPMDGKAWVQAFMQGGGFGIYQDILLSQSSMGTSGLLKFMGPAVGSADQIWKLRERAQAGENVLPQLFKIGKDHLPLNLFYMKKALDYSILYWLQDMVQPGVLERQEQRIQRETGRSYKYLPSQNIGNIEAMSPFN